MYVDEYESHQLQSFDHLHRRNGGDVSNIARPQATPPTPPPLSSRPIANCYLMDIRILTSVPIGGFASSDEECGSSQQWLSCTIASSLGPFLSYRGEKRKGSDPRTDLHDLVYTVRACGCVQ